MNQEKINLNVQERLRALEAREQVFVALAVAFIETHPRPDVFRKQFAFHVETLRAQWLEKPLPEDFLDEADALQQLLSGAFDRPRI